MNTTHPYICGFVCCLSAVLLLAIPGCSKTEKSKDLPVARTPKEAATQLEQAFASAPIEEVKQTAAVASKAITTGEYEAAVMSLTAIKSKQNLTLEQGMAVHNSMVLLESRLIAAMQAGDQNAKRAYELLKRTKRQ
jgi:hypothetical protein